MNNRMQQWMSEKPQFSNDGTQLRGFMEGDIILFNFVANGDDGDVFLKAFRAHAFQVPSRNGGRPNTANRYCPIQNGEQGVPCVYCQQGHSQMKERMNMWLYVQAYLHAQLPQPRQGEAPMQLPAMEYQGRYYYVEQRNKFQLWETSAWKDSPWNDINKLAEVYRGLHNFTGEMTVVGKELSRRFKIIALPNTAGLPPEIYEKAKQECTPIRQLLQNDLLNPIQINPAAVAQPQQVAGNVWGMPAAAPVMAAPPVVPFALPGQPAIPSFAPGAVAPTPEPVTVPTFSVPGFTPPATVIPTVSPTPEQPAEQQVPVTPTMPTFAPPPPPAPVEAAPTVATVVEQPVVATPLPQMPTAPVVPPATAEDNKRPLQSLF